MIRLVALDMAGTTVDDGGAVYDALHGAVAAHPLNAASEITAQTLQQWMGAEKRTAMRELTRVASGVEPDAEAVEAMYSAFRQQLAAAYRHQPPTPIPGVPELFATLRSRGVKIALTTGFARDVADPLLHSLGWRIGETVDAVVCGDEVPAGRPAPYLIFRAMERTGVTSVHEVLVAGDTVVDLRAGLNAGARTVVGVTTGKLSFPELGVERHTHLLSSVAGIAGLLAGD